MTRRKFARHARGLMKPLLEVNQLRVERVIRRQQCRALCVREPARHQIQIEPLVTTVNLVAHNGMPQVRHVDPDLMLAPGEETDREQRELPIGAREPPQWAGVP